MTRQSCVDVIVMLLVLIALSADT